jgi:DNA replication protein DnaC
VTDPIKSTVVAMLENLRGLAGSADISERLVAASQDWAETHFATRRQRIEDARVRLEDDEVVGVAVLDDRPMDEPPTSEEHERRRVALAAIRAKRAPRLPAYSETSTLTAVRNALRGRAKRDLEKPFIMLLGSVGTTKTSAAAHAIASIPGGRCIDAGILCDIQGSFADRPRLTELRESPVVLVDEIKKELLATRKLGPILCDLIDARRGGRRITIFNANMLAKELAGAFPEQTRSRLRGRVDWVQVAGEDLRKKRRG